MPTVSFPYASCEEISEGRILAWLSYPGIIFGLLGLLFLVPMLAHKDNPFSRYHARQGMFLFLASVLVAVFFWVVYGVILVPIIDLSPVAWIVTAITGLVVITGTGITIFVFAVSNRNRKGGFRRILQDASYRNHGRAVVSRHGSPNLFTNPKEG